MQWSGASDDADVDGYSIEWSGAPDTGPDDVIDLPGAAEVEEPRMVSGGSTCVPSTQAATRPPARRMQDRSLMRHRAAEDPDVWSDTHEAHEPSRDDTVEASWADAWDDGSGVAGYSIDWTRRRLAA